MENTVSGFYSIIFKSLLKKDLLIKMQDPYKAKNCFKFLHFFECINLKLLEIPGLNRSDYVLKLLEKTVIVFHLEIYPEKGPFFPSIKQLLPIWM